MKKGILMIKALFMVILLGAFALPQEDKGILTVYAGNFNSDDGKAIVNLFKKGDNVTKEPYKQVSCKIVNQKATLTFDDLPYGDYAAIVWHDENDNGDLDHSWGFPAEPMGFSNQWKLSLFSGMPSFEKLKFTFTNTKNTVTIDVK